MISVAARPPIASRSASGVEHFVPRPPRRMRGYACITFAVASALVIRRRHQGVAAISISVRVSRSLACSDVDEAQPCYSKRPLTKQIASILSSLLTSLGSKARPKRGRCSGR
jgi:hypothetical protein